MDMTAMGKFLSQLRREHEMTQEQLGDKLGVTNKTVSRWETGRYMPPVETLQALSDLYGVTIHEILAGKRADQSDYQDLAEENIKQALHSRFTVKDRIEFFKTKWKKDHKFSTWLVCMGFAVLYVLGLSQESQMLNLIVTLGACFYGVSRYNAMMAYVERNAFDPIQGENEDDCGDAKEQMRWTRVRVMAMLLVSLCIWICGDLGCNLLFSLVPELNDGITIHGFWAKLFFGTDGTYWSRAVFFEGFENAFQVLTVIGIGNILLACLEKMKK